MDVRPPARQLRGVLAGALLFTNAVEWIGHRLELGEGAVGSLLAAVGTAMPETLIAIVALLGAERGLRRRRDRGDRRRPLPARDPGDGPGRPLRLRSTASGAPQGRRARSPRADPGARPDLLPRLLRARRAARLGPAGGAADRRRRRLPRSPTSFYVRLHPARRRRGAGRGDAQPADLRPPRRAARRPRPRALRRSSSWSASAAMVGGAHLFVEELLEHRRQPSASTRWSWR